MFAILRERNVQSAAAAGSSISREREVDTDEKNVCARAGASRYVVYIENDTWTWHTSTEYRENYIRLEYFVVRGSGGDRGERWGDGKPFSRHCIATSYTQLSGQRTIAEIEWNVRLPFGTRTQVIQTFWLGIWQRDNMRIHALIATGNNLFQLEMSFVTYALCSIPPTSDLQLFRLAVLVTARSYLYCYFITIILGWNIFICKSYCDGLNGPCGGNRNNNNKRRRQVS